MPNQVETEFIDFSSEFPILQRVPGRIYADNAAMSLRPQSVINTVSNAYTKYGANVHRGGHAEGEAATEAFEDARVTVASFLGALPSEIVFTSGCTQALNMVALGCGLSSDDEIVVSELEHNSNFLPWLRQGQIKVIPTDECGKIDLDALRSLLSPRTRVLALTHASNVSGVIQPVTEACAIARAHGVISVIDAAQTVGHLPVDVSQIGCDFLTFSGHKALGPSGIGVLYGREDALAALEPVLRGGGMAELDEFLQIAFARLPHALEPGTPPIEAALGLAAALRFSNKVGVKKIEERNRALSRNLRGAMLGIQQFRTPFAPEGSADIPILTLAAHDIALSATELAMILSDSYGVSVRAGFFCCPLLFQRRQEPEAIRISLNFYNTEAEIEQIREGFLALSRLSATKGGSSGD